MKLHIESLQEAWKSPDGTKIITMVNGTYKCWDGSLLKEGQDAEGETVQKTSNRGEEETWFKVAKPRPFGGGGGGGKGWQPKGIDERNEIIAQSCVSSAARVMAQVALGPQMDYAKVEAGTLKLANALYDFCIRKRGVAQPNSAATVAAPPPRQAAPPPPPPAPPRQRNVVSPPQPAEPPVGATDEERANELPF